MFEGLLKRLKGAHTAPLPDDDARLALATLLVRIARSDHHYAFEEIVQIDQVLAARYDISIIAYREGYMGAEQFFQMPNNKVRVLVILAPGRDLDPPSFRDPSSLFEEAARYR